MLVEGHVFELDGIRYVKVMHCFPKIIGGCIILSAAVSFRRLNRVWCRT